MAAEEYGKAGSRAAWHDGQATEESSLRPDSMTRIVLRPLASSLPLGFLAFGTGTILLTSLELHWVPVSQSTPLMIMVLAFVAPLEVMAGVLAY